MEIRTSTTGSTSTFEKIAIQENEIFIRIFFPNGSFINYLVEPEDIEKFGLAAIFEMIDPDEDYLRAQKEFERVESKPKRKNTSRSAA
jgi:hypothetical protein